MALIPPDAGIRMRMQTDASLLQPVQPSHEITGDLPELQAGQAFTARILEALPDNMFRALVTGKQITLQLPQGADTGDTLELVVVGRSGKTLVAQRTDATASSAPAEQPYANANISRAGQMIGQLLLPEGESPQPAPLGSGQPLLAQAPTSAADLVPTLAKAVSQSGLFYEAHQAEWVAGRRPIESLQAEPHNQDSRPTGQPARAPAPMPAETPTSTTPIAAGDAGNDKSVAQNAPQSVPDQLRPLVQQQLDAVTSQRLAWHGEVWPGQVMDLQIERDRTEESDSRRADQGEEVQRWSTTLRLSMPRLGNIDATLQIAGHDLRLRLSAASESAAADLRANAVELNRALGAAGVSLQAFEVGRESD